jgi:aryl-alcohol dehydrogenase-like predicted oxidoreductase
MIMETRRLGRTEHLSTVAIFGAAALWDVSQKEADEVIKLIINRGVNHIDVAPSYGNAEKRLGPWLARERKRFFVGCKTGERTKADAAAELHKSLGRLHIDRFDLYQIHAITNLEDLDIVTRRGGALEALVEAKEAGLTRYLGITGHGVDAPATFLEALQRFDFDTVLFPINFVQYAEPKFREYTEELLRQCREKDVGTMIIKSIARGPWGDKVKAYNTWYEPFTDIECIQAAVNFVLSQDVTGLCTAGDTRLIPLILDACDNYKTLNKAEQAELIESAINFESLFV